MYEPTREKNCTTCEYAIEQPIGEDLTKRVVCILNPPTVFGIGTAQGIANVTAFPQVTIGMICSKWKNKTDWVQPL